MICSKCQAELPDSAKFCNKCGNSLIIKCPKCSTENPPDSFYCLDCGNELRKPGDEPVDYSQPQSYTPKHLQDKILTTRSSIEGERKLVTVFFADVANYTAMSEKLDPEEVHQIMDECFKILMDEIHTYEGTINQFTGDGVMALFGAPVAHEDHAQRACYAALSIKNAMEGYGEKIKRDTGVDFIMRIGLNSGHVIVGSIGDDLRMDYTAVGDTTNLAARMESEADPGTILVSENTQKIAQHYFEFESIGKLEVKGKEKPQEAYKLIKTGEIETRIGASVAKGLTRFVGRKNSMAALMEPFEKVQEESGQVVGIVGEAGVGKSRILLEFINRLPQGEFTYLAGQCLQYGENIIYRPIIDIVKSYFEIKEGDREFVIKKKILDKTFELDGEFSESSLPVFQDFLSSKVDDEDYKKLEPQQKREKTFESIKDLFIRESNKKPLVIAIEDLHWIDKTSEEFLDYLIDWIAKAPILLILLYRTEYRHQWGSKTYYNRIGLDHLRAESSTELVKAMLEEDEVASELRELILNRTAGNPLFMEEFTHTLLENGSIKKKDKQYVLSRNISDSQVPDTIQGIITARMDRLEDNLKRTMQVASVIGRDFAFRILQSITGMREELKSYLLNLQGLEFIYEKSLFPELEYIFKHALTQEVAYNSLLLKRRKEIHEQIGKAIEELYPERLEELYEMLAYHYSESDNLEKAYQYLKLSGEKAAKNYANLEAFRFYKEAIDALNKLPDTEEHKKLQIEVRLLIGNTLTLLGYPKDSLHILQEGKRLSEEVGDNKSLALFYMHIANTYNFNGNILLAIEHGEKGLIEGEKNQDIEVIVPLASMLTMAYNVQGMWFKTARIFPKVIDLIEKTKRVSDFFGLPLNPYVFLCGYGGSAMSMLGNYEEGQIICEKGLRHAAQIADPFSIAIAELQFGSLFVNKGDAKPAIEHLQNSYRYGEEINNSMLLSHASSEIGYGYYMLGDLETAIDQIEKGLKIQIDSGVQVFLSTHYMWLSIVHSESDDLKIAQSDAEKALELCRENNEKQVEGQTKIWLGRILGKKESAHSNPAIQHIIEGITILKTLKLRTHTSQGYLFLGELYVDTGQNEKALENLKKAEAEFEVMGVDYWLARTYAVYGELYKKEGEALKAREDLNKAIEILKECGADGWVKKYEKELTAIS